MTPSGIKSVRAHYLLPCSCGAKIAVEPRQAGQAVQCVCGKSATVPTLLEMTKLERVEAADERGSARNPPGWGVSQRLLVLGGVALLLAAVAAAVAICCRPPPRIADLSLETIQQQVESWPAFEVVREYRELKKKGLGRGIAAADDRYNRELAIYHLWWGVAAVFSLLGIGLLDAGIVLRRRTEVPSP